VNVTISLPDELNAGETYGRVTVRQPFREG
jgi:hypothetical protein